MLKNISYFLISSFLSFHTAIASSSEDDIQIQLKIIAKQEQISREERGINALNVYLEALAPQNESAILDVCEEIALKTSLVKRLRKDVDGQLRGMGIQIPQSDFLPEPNNTERKRQHSETLDPIYGGVKQRKINATDIPSTSQTCFGFNKDTLARPIDKFGLNELSTQAQHRRFLLDAIYRAKKYILITSYKFQYDQEIIKALQVAASKNIKIYLYFYDTFIDERILENLEHIGINLRCINIHSKIFSIDNEFVAVGSYNWLSNDDSFNQTVVFEGKSAYDLKQHLWDYIKQYASISDKDTPLWRIGEVSQQFSHDLPYNLITGPQDQLTVLTTPFQHHKFFVNCFNQATRRVVIHAPFITSDPGYLAEITPIQELKSFFQANKALEIVYRGEDQNIILLMDFMDDMFSGYKSSIIWTPIHNLHKKTIVVDDNLITSGSFNWFSSARDLEDDFMLMETTLVLKGGSAKWLIGQR